MQRWKIMKLLQIFVVITLFPIRIPYIKKTEVRNTWQKSKMQLRCIFKMLSVSWNKNVLMKKDVICYAKHRFYFSVPVPISLSFSIHSSLTPQELLFLVIFKNHRYYLCLSILQITVVRNCQMLFKFTSLFVTRPVSCMIDLIYFCLLLL